MVPVAGDEFEVMDTMDEAKIGAAEQAEISRTSRLAAQAGEGKVTLHSFANAVASGRETGVEQHQLNLILKVDAQVQLRILSQGCIRLSHLN
jgi:translation initiation factor IF-2